MGDSTEEMLNVTMKRLKYIMDVDTEKALQAEAHNLIDAAIALLKMNAEDMDAQKVFGYWEKLQGLAKELYIQTLRLVVGSESKGQFHWSKKIMSMIVLCKREKERIVEYMKRQEADAEEPRQPEKVIKYKNGKPHFDYE